MADNNLIKRLDNKVDINAKDNVIKRLDDKVDITTKNNITEIFVENDEPLLDSITLSTSKATYFDDSSAAKIYEINYKDCWEDLRGQLQQYLKDKKGNDYRDPYGRYCVALAINDLFEWMNKIENKHIKNW